MGETIRPVEEESYPYSFRTAIDFFPEIEQDDARDYLAVYEKFYRLVDMDYSIMDPFTDFYHNNRERLINCKLSRLFTGSSQTCDQWEKLPMDTPEHDWEKFIRGYIIPLIEKSQKTEKPVAT